MAKLTQELIDAVAESVRKGAHPEVAAAARGVGEKQFSKWMDLATRNKSRYLPLLKAIRRAQAECELEMATVLYLNGCEDPRYAKDMLTLRYRDRWARTEGLQVSGPGGGPIDFQLLRDQILEKLGALKGA